MTLSNLIRKGGLAQIATATRATPATQEAGGAATVAKVATVAVARPTADLAEHECRAIEYAEDVAHLRKKGIRPPSYTDEATCDHCGPVYLWRDAPHRVAACPWCRNTRLGLPVPRPQVACADCRYFEVDPVGYGGIGLCQSGGPQPGQMLRYPHARRQCTNFIPLETTP